MTFKKQCERMQNFTNLTKGYKSANFLWNLTKVNS
jgi:hypothetical protein